MNCPLDFLRYCQKRKDERSESKKKISDDTRYDKVKPDIIFCGHCGFGAPMLQLTPRKAKHERIEDGVKAVSKLTKEEHLSVYIKLKHQKKQRSWLGNFWEIFGKF